MRALFRQLDQLISKLPISPRFFRFCVVGGSGVFVNMAVLALFRLLLPATWGLWQNRTAVAAGIAVSIFTNFLLNDLWTWGDHEKGDRGQWFGRLAKFYLVSSSAAVVQWGVSVLLHEQLGLLIYLAVAIGIIVAMGINFTMNHLWTFRSRRTGG